jgi:hypothetical protein
MAYGSLLPATAANKKGNNGASVLIPHRMRSDRTHDAPIKEGDLAMSRFVLLLLGVMALLVAPASEATKYRASLSGSAENPATGSPGVGVTAVDINTSTHLLHVTVAFSGLVAGTTASHIHCCVVPPGNAGVATTTPTFAGFPLGVTAGSYDNTLDMTQASSWNPAFITASGGTTAGAEAALANGIAAGQAYLNIHSTTFPSGEIRGVLVPDPGTPNIPTLSEWSLAALAAALALAVWVTMKRRSA